MSIQSDTLAAVTAAVSMDAAAGQAVMGIQNQLAVIENMLVHAAPASAIQAAIADLGTAATALAAAIAAKAG